MIENLTIAIVAGMFGFLPALLQWISDRNKTRSINHRITKLSTELNFIEQWAKLSGSVSGSSESGASSASSGKVQQLLDSILNEYASIRTAKLEERTKPAEVSVIRRMLLLFRPSSGGGWMIHTIFYFLVFFIVAIIISGIQEPMINPETGENELLFLLLGIAILFGPLLIFLQRMAMRVRKKELEKSNE